jgi:hypothetical protein
MMYRAPWWLGNNPWGGHPFFIGIILLVIWSATTSGLALWHAARREEKGWFVWFLLVHTMGIVEILYLIFVAKAFVTSPKTSSRRRAK